MGKAYFCCWPVRVSLLLPPYFPEITAGCCHFYFPAIAAVERNSYYFSDQYRISGRVEEYVKHGVGVDRPNDIYTRIINFDPDL